jgi:hypothetical protein
MASQIPKLEPNMRSAPSNPNANVRRRREMRVDGLQHLGLYILLETLKIVVADAQALLAQGEMKNERRLESIREIVCWTIWINIIGLATLEEGYPGFPQMSRESDDQYTELLTDEELSFAKDVNRLYEPHMGNSLMEHVRVLTLVEASAFVTDCRSIQYFSKIYRIRKTVQETALNTMRDVQKNRCREDSGAIWFV